MEGTVAHSCDLCLKDFTKKSNLHQHQKQVHGGEKPHKCLICSKTFSRKLNKELHTKTCTNNVNARGEVKRKSYGTTGDLNLTPFKRSSSFGGITAVWWIRYPKEYHSLDPIMLLKKSTKAMKDIMVEHNLAQTMRMKYTMSVHVTFMKLADPDIKTEPPIVLTTDPTTVWVGTDIDHSLENTAEELIDLIEVFERNGSGWVIDYLYGTDMDLYSF